MSDEERLRDAALAVKYEGWRWMRNGLGDRGIVHPDDMNDLNPSWWSGADGTEPLPVDWKQTAYSRKALPDYLHDIKAAYGLLEAVCKATGYYWSMVQGYDGYIVELVQEDPSVVVSDVAGATLPAAICEAIEALP